jgi:hypothetical protein
MRVLLLIICLAFVFQSGYAENAPDSKKEHAESKKEIKVGSLVIYKDRCVATLPIKFSGEKEHSLTVPGSIDSQSILFHQESNLNPEYVISKNKDVLTAVDWILNSKHPFQGEITYTFSGIGWHMHYVVEVSEQFDEIQNFNSFVSIDNQSGASFENIRLRLVDAQTDDLAKNQTFHEYVIDTPKFINKGSVVRIPWVEIHKQKAGQDYRLDVGKDNLKDLQGINKQIPLQIWLHFKLDEKRSQDLANGDITIYIRDHSNALRFLGSSALPSTKSGDDIQLAIPPLLLAQLKSSHDSPLTQIQGNLEQTEFKTLLTEKVTEAAYRLTIRNFGEKEANIKVMLPFGENRGKVVRESMAHKQESSQSVYWPVRVAPKTEVVLRYRVQLMKE